MNHKNHHMRSLSLLWCLLLAGFGATALAQSPPPRLISLDISAQPLGDALAEFGKQADLAMVFYDKDLGKGLNAKPLTGTFTAEDALAQLLSNTGLRYEYLDRRTIAIHAAQSGKPSADISQRVDGTRFAQTSMQKNENVLSSAEDKSSEKSTDSDKTRDPLQEIVVTGTHIKGAGPVGSPVRSYSSEDIASSGAVTTAEFLESLPQNFGGGISEDTANIFVPGNGRTNNNASQGTGVNLRGLGSDATLLLVNGHRLTQTGAGDFVDVNQIPMASIDRIEVLTDGASAIYGSDAVAGVVNIVLKKSFEGVATRARYGSVTDGSFSRYGAGATIGRSWNAGSAVLSYDYSQQSELTRQDRPFARLPVGDLIPGRRAHHAVLNGQQQLGEALLNFDGIYAYLNNQFLAPLARTSTLPEEIRDTPSENFSASVGLGVPLFSDWAGNVLAVFSDSNITVNRKNASTGVPAARTLYRNDLKSIAASLSGSLVAMPAGNMRGTLGIDFRRERFNFNTFQPNSTTPSTHIAGSRDVSSAYLEALVPVVAGNENGSGRLELSAAGRYEDYSDFGSTTNPKIGLAWTPLSGLKIRATYGRSFRTPSFNQLDTSNNVTYIFSMPDPDAAHPSLALVQLGNSSSFRPEKSESWDVGLDVTPRALAGFSMSVDFFRTEFMDKFQRPSSTTTTILANEGVFASIITRSPTAAQIETVIANPGAFGLQDLTSGSNPRNAVAIIDNRAQNIGVTLVSGVDVVLRQEFELPSLRWRLMLDGTRFHEYSNRITAQSAEIDVDGMIFNPPKWRVRGGAGISMGPVDATVLVSHMPNYLNNAVTPGGAISSWTTVDASVGYEADASGAWFMHNLALRLSLQNLADRDPPFVSATGSAGVLPVGYDAANASPIGRFINLEVAKRF